MGFLSKIFGNKVKKRNAMPLKTDTGIRSAATSARPAHTELPQAEISRAYGSTVIPKMTEVKHQIVHNAPYEGDIIDLNNGKVKVSKKYLLDKYVKRAVIPEDIFWRCIDGDGYIILPKHRLDKMEHERLKQIEKDEQLMRCADLNNKGIALEKEGKITEAIEVYECNIASNTPYPATHAYDRLMILYRKQKDYDNEIRIIKKAMKVFPKEPKYRERLAKAEKLANVISKTRHTKQANVPNFTCVTKCKNNPSNNVGSEYWFN